jgi:hypothetical protein
MRTVLRGLMLLALSFGAMVAWADDERAYTEGAVISVNYVKTEPGMFDEYLKYLAGPYKHLLEEQKKAGLIVDYGIYQAFPSNPHEPDLILTIVYKNWAARDGLRDKVDPFVKKQFGSSEGAAKASAERGKLRQQLGGQWLQELKLK